MFTDLIGLVAVWSWYFTGKWWFYPSAVIYLTIGYWFGILNYWVAKKSDLYPYWVRFSLYPFTTFCREGWLRMTHGLIVGGDKSSSIYYSNTFTAARFFEEVSVYQSAELYYATLLAVSWGIKILTNIFTITVLVVLSFIILVCGAVLVIACSIWFFIVSGFLLVVEWGRSVFSAARPAMDEGGGAKTEVK